MTVHSFRKSLAKSEAGTNELGWRAFYRAAFPDHSGLRTIKGSHVRQIAGVDRFVDFDSGESIGIDEKERHGDYTDVLVEVVSNDRTGALGWAVKGLISRYVAYAIIRRDRCYLIDVVTLRSAVLACEAGWRKTHRVIAVLNEGYRTINIPVEVKDLRAAGVLISEYPFGVDACAKVTRAHVAAPPTPPVVKQLSLLLSSGRQGWR